MSFDHRNADRPRVRGVLASILLFTAGQMIGAWAGKKEQNAPAAQNTLGRRWMMFLQKRVEHVFLCCVLRVNRARKRGRRFTCKQNARAVRFNVIEGHQMLPRARFQASRWALLNPAGGEWSRTDSRGQVLRNQPSAIGHGHNDVRWMRMFMFRRRNPKAIDLQKCNGFEGKTY